MLLPSRHHKLQPRPVRVPFRAPTLRKPMPPSGHPPSGHPPPSPPPLPHMWPSESLTEWQGGRAASDPVAQWPGVVTYKLGACFEGAW